MHKIRKDDMVKVIAGKDKDKTGKVLHVDTKKNTVMVAVSYTHLTLPTIRLV